MLTKVNIIVAIEGEQKLLQAFSIEEQLILIKFEVVADNTVEI